MPVFGQLFKILWKNVANYISFRYFFESDSNHQTNLFLFFHNENLFHYANATIGSKTLKDIFNGYVTIYSELGDISPYEYKNIKHGIQEMEIE